MLHRHLNRNHPKSIQSKAIDTKERELRLEPRLPLNKINKTANNYYQNISSNLLQMINKPNNYLLTN